MIEHFGTEDSHCPGLHHLSCHPLPSAECAEALVEPPYFWWLGFPKGTKSAPVSFLEVSPFAENITIPCTPPTTPLPYVPAQLMGQVNCEATSEPAPTPAVLSLLTLTPQPHPQPVRQCSKRQPCMSISKTQSLKGKHSLWSVCVLGKVHLLSTVGSWRDDFHLLRASWLPSMELTCPAPDGGLFVGRIRGG